MYNINIMFILHLLRKLSIVLMTTVLFFPVETFINIYIFLFACIDIKNKKKNTRKRFKMCQNFQHFSIRKYKNISQLSKGLLNKEMIIALIKKIQSVFNFNLVNETF